MNAEETLSTIRLILGESRMKQADGEVIAAVVDLMIQNETLESACIQRVQEEYPAPSWMESLLNAIDTLDDSIRMCAAILRSEIDRRKV